MDVVDRGAKTIRMRQAIPAGGILHRLAKTSLSVGLRYEFERHTATKAFKLRLEAGS